MYSGKKPSPAPRLFFFLFAHGGHQQRKFLKFLYSDTTSGRLWQTSTNCTLHSSLGILRNPPLQKSQWRIILDVCATWDVERVGSVSSSDKSFCTFLSGEAKVLRKTSVLHTTSQLVKSGFFGVNAGFYHYCLLLTIDKKYVKYMVSVTWFSEEKEGCI